MKFEAEVSFAFRQLPREKWLRTFRGSGFLAAGVFLTLIAESLGFPVPQLAWQESDLLVVGFRRRSH